MTARATLTPPPLIHIMEEIEDPRVPRTRPQPLSSIILIAILGAICSSDTQVDIELFGQRRRHWLATFRNLPHGIPAHDTCGRVFAELEAAQFEVGFLRWMQSVTTALDGQTVRGSPN